MTLERKHVRGKAAQAQNTVMSQAVPQNTVDNPFDTGGQFEPYGYGYVFRYGQSRRHFLTVDDFMTFLADQAIEKMQRVEQ